ncbi:uncharacterized protein LOC123922694 [Trifolium pratense]|uniref:Uncharacterized protein n=1 Tax=Trifolium pratense TaxID=57577 RepID=A0ACB0IR21_TRIPR|nr:uncharacterized protein LOC123922694 [Trifolium pratense]CAJ2634612.1 unnamed protein product [Trifolium pratense]
MASRNVSSITKSHSHTKQPHRTCMCSPTNHPGSFRCSIHKKPPRAVVARPSSSSFSNPNYNYLDHSSMAMVAKVNISLKAILLQIIKHRSSRDLHRRKNFKPKPTRFSVMNHVAVS